MHEVYVWVKRVYEAHCDQTIISMMTVSCLDLLRLCKWKLVDVEGGNKCVDYACPFQGLSRHPGYASMRAKHLALLRMVALTEDGNANPSAQTCHPTFQFSTGSLSQRFFDFRFLNNWEEVQAVVDRLGPELSPVHLEAAYSRVKSLKLIPSTEFMDELANRSISLSHCMSARNISSILHACAKLQYNNPEMVETLAQTMLSEGQISKLDCLDMASIVFALGALNQLKHAEDRGERSKKQQEREGIPMVFASEKEFTQVGCM